MPKPNRRLQDVCNGEYTRWILVLHTPVQAVAPCTPSKITNVQSRTPTEYGVLLEALQVSLQASQFPMDASADSRRAAESADRTTSMAQLVPKETWRRWNLRRSAQIVR